MYSRNIFQNEKQEEKEALERLNKKIEEVLADQKRTVRGIIHDIRNPLTYSSMTIQVLELMLKTHFASGETPLKEKIFEYLNVIKKGYKEIEGILENALDDNVKFRNSNLKLLLHSIVQNFQSSSLHEGRSFELHYAIPGECFVFDPNKITRAVNNLINNASKHTVHGMIITEVTEDPKHFVISIKDSGTGINPEALKNIFKYGYSEDNSGTHGLDLWNVQKIAQMHKGIAEAYSTPGVGSIFKIIIPKDLHAEIE